MSAAAGARLAVTLLSVLPVPVRSGHGHTVDPPDQTPDRAAAGWAMVWSPLVGAVLGGLAGVVGAGAAGLGLPVPVAGTLSVVVLAGLSRGLHLDGLADTADAFGVYARGRDRALEVMKSPGVGAFGLIAVVLVVAVQCAALTSIVGSLGWGTVPLAVAAGAIGRYGATLACLRAVPAARPDGLGALVAGTVGPATATAVGLALALASTVLAVAAGLPAVSGPVAVTLGAVVAATVIRRSTTRFGGVTGDVLGAAVELATTVALVVLSWDQRT